MLPLTEQLRPPYEKEMKLEKGPLHQALPPVDGQVCRGELVCTSDHRPERHAQVGLSPCELLARGETRSEPRSWGWLGGLGRS